MRTEGPGLTCPLALYSRHRQFARRGLNPGGGVHRLDGADRRTPAAIWRALSCAFTSSMPVT